jgi:arginyl-tRNA synthetase
MIEEILKNNIAEAVQSIYKETIQSDSVTFQETRKEFEGDITLVVFSFTKFSKQSPEQTATSIGEYLKTNVAEVSGFNVVKGFLNIVIADNYWINFFNSITKNTEYGFVKPMADSPAVMVEYSSPNTNKPLHLGHVRNNLLGYSVAEILKAAGNTVIKTNLVNDRGIHICKSMLAWQKWGNGETPESSGLKGDHLVGKYYVIFDKEYKKEIDVLKEKGLTEDDAKKKAPLIIEAQSMLVKWEANAAPVVDLWKMMNSWVYDGFGITYKRLGVDFDKMYYESNTYLLGKEIVEEGLAKGVFYKKEDGSVWIDLTEDGLDHKLVLRSDGTSVYITQDLGTAEYRFNEFNINKLVYVVGNEQEYHFKVLLLILQKMGKPWAKGLYHLSYGMVDLPSGKMKSREGTVVDADELIAEMINSAKSTTEALGKTDGFTTEQANCLYETIGLGALKYFILKVDPKKRMLFNPEESIDFNGNTGPFLQYTYARIQSVLRKGITNNALNYVDYTNPLESKEKELLKTLYNFPIIIKNAADNYAPSVIANYAYELTKGYNQFYHELPIVNENESITAFRLQLSASVSYTLKNALLLLGIGVTDRM